ncbi:MAG: tRNA dihydrouridine synthase [Candidatus Paceibacteria bacterium]
MKDFWKELPRPFFALAPMADVTDAAFRRIIAKYSKKPDIRRRAFVTWAEKPDIRRRAFVMWTEFVSADGLVLAPEEGKKKLLADLLYTESERPIVAQLFSSRPENIEKAAALVAKLGFDGVDINMGCPDRSIEKQGAGAAHIQDPARAKEVIAAAKQGAGGLPVSVKTRLGYNKDELDTWLPHLLETGLSAITIHARTRKEMSKVPARWERIARAVELRNKHAPETLIIGNGDLADLNDAHAKVVETGADGAMLGRAIFGNPWLFSKYGHAVSIFKRMQVMVEHTKLFEELLPHKNFAIMKKHYKAYVAGFNGAAELREKLMSAENADAVARITEHFLRATPAD